jgi:hypothetical protein
VEELVVSCAHLQGYTIHMFDGKVEIRKSSDNMFVMIGWEDDILLKLKGTSTQA